MLIHRLGNPFCPGRRYLCLTLFTMNLIASSIYKMNLYETAYGYTYLRLFVKFALVFFSLGLALMILYMMKATREIIKPLTMLAISMYIILSLLNLEGFIFTKPLIFTKPAVSLILRI